MCEQVNINVSETNETINIVSSEIQEVIDINVFESTEDVTLNITEQLIQVNVNKVTAAAVTNTSELINDGEDGVHPFITAEDLPSLTGYVPYTGATEDVNLGEFGLLTGNIEFDNTPTNIPTTAGAIYWNDSDGTADLILKGGNVKLQVGQESVIRVVNKTATNINLLEANYQAVRVTGAQGQRLKVDLAQATTDNLSAETIGLVTETINNNQEGFITTSGLVRNINTTGSLQGETWADGDILYLSPTTAGNVTKVKPTAPNHLVIVGYVVYAHANQGSIFVKVDNGYELDELHNCKITSAANNNVLAYTSATDIWENKTVETALGFTPENVANKSTSTSLGTSNTLYPTQNAVKVYADTKFTLPSLTSGSVLFSNGTTIAQDNANFFWDDTNNRLGIGTASPANTLDVNGTARFVSTLVANTGVKVGGASGVGGVYVQAGSTLNQECIALRGSLLTTDIGSDIILSSGNGSAANTTSIKTLVRFSGGFVPASGTGVYNVALIDPTINQTGGANGITRGLYINPTLTSAADFRAIENSVGKVCLNTTSGNTMIGTSTDAGFKLDVNGTARVSDISYLTLGARIGTTTTAAGIFPSGTSGRESLNLRSSLLPTDTGNDVIITNGQGDVGNTSSIRSLLTVARSFAPTSGTGVYNLIQVNPTINQTGGANGITRGLYINPTLTAAADFRAIEVANGVTVLAASVAARASLRIPSGTAPTTPTNGDIWFDGTDLKIRVAGVTRTIVLL